MKYSCRLPFKFHKVLKYFLPRNGWIIFSRLNTIKDFTNTFPSLTLHAVNSLLWKKILSLSLFKIITFSRTCLIPWIFLIGILGFPTKGEASGRESSVKHKIFGMSLLLDITFLTKKNESLCSYSDHRPHIGKKVSLIVFRQI